MKYHIITKNNTERLQIMKAAQGLGFQCHSFAFNERPTAEQFCAHFPWSEYPTVVLTDERKKEIAGNASCYGNIDFATFWQQYNAAKAEKAIVFPKPAKYTMTYKKSNGEVENYTISNPIEETGSDFTAYAFNRGVRTFKKAGVLSFEKVA